MYGNRLEPVSLKGQVTADTATIRRKSAAGQPAALDTPWKSIVTVILLLLLQVVCLLIRMYDKFEVLPVRTWV